ncbi:MAG: hydroxymethylbilane synthase [Terriglobia bacterium]
MSQQKLIIGSRGSQLALRQSSWVKQELERARPDFSITLEIIKTSGDVILDAPLSKIGGKGVFTKEIEEALLAGKIDLAVHSLKDLPTVLSDGLCLGAVSSREDARDAFLSNRFRGIHELPAGARIGTSSLRRQSQLFLLRKDLQITNLRGNLDTRLRKLDEQQYDAILLACAGLDRLGLGHRITQRIPVDEICPAVGQGALVIEIRENDPRVAEVAQLIHSSQAATATMAERAFLRRLGGGCQVPIAAHAWETGGVLSMLGVVASPDGRTSFRLQEQASPQEPDQLGVRLAEKLLEMGAQQIVDEIAGQALSNPSSH